MTEPHPAAPGEADRHELSSMQDLLVLSMRMAEISDEKHIVRLAAAAVPSLGGSHLEGIHLIDDGWHSMGGACSQQTVRADVEAQFAVLGPTGGELAIQGLPWGWAFPLRSIDDHFGHFVLGSTDDPSAQEQFLLRVLARHTGIALANARLHRRQREIASALKSANDTLIETVRALKRNNAVHERLSSVAVAGAGIDGIVRALHDLTGRPVAVEDRYGNLRAWAGPDRPDPYPKNPPSERDELTRRARLNGPSMRHGDRLVTVMEPQPGVFAVLALVDPDDTAGEAERVALQHGATVLAIELSHLHGLTETELRLGRGLVDQLVSGVDDQYALEQAQGLDYDLERPHRVIVVDCPGADLAADARFQGVRRAARDTGTGSLLVHRDGQVVLLAHGEPGWEQLRQAIVAELRQPDCRIGVGTPCTLPTQFPHSYRTARLALGIHDQSGAPGQAVVFEELGIYQVLADTRDLAEIERLVQRWLGALIDYDRDHTAELVATLDRYLRAGRSYGASAKALSVHRSTLKYRLQRVHEISGHDLGDPDTLFNLQLALRAWHTLSALRAVPL